MPLIGHHPAPTTPLKMLRFRNRNYSLRILKSHKLDWHLVLVVTLLDLDGIRAIFLPANSITRRPARGVWRRHFYVINTFQFNELQNLYIAFFVLAFPESRLHHLTYGCVFVDVYALFATPIGEEVFFPRSIPYTVDSSFVSYSLNHSQQLPIQGELIWC